MKKFLLVALLGLLVYSCNGNQPYQPSKPDMYPCILFASVEDANGNPIPEITVDFFVKEDHPDSSYHWFTSSVTRKDGRCTIDTEIYGPRIYSVQIIATDPTGAYKPDTAYCFMYFGDEGDSKKTGCSYYFVLSSTTESEETPKVEAILGEWESIDMPSMGERIRFDANNECIYTLNYDAFQETITCKYSLSVNTITFTPISHIYFGESISIDDPIYAKVWCPYKPNTCVFTLKNDVLTIYRFPVFLSGYYKLEMHRVESQQK